MDKPLRFKQVVVHESVGPIVDFALIVNRQRHKFRVFESLRIIHESREIDPNGLLWLPNTRHVLFENCSLDASEYQVAVGFDQHDLARVGLVHQELGHLDLQRRMQMSLGALDRHDLVLPQQPGLNHDGSQLVEAGTHDMPRGPARHRGWSNHLCKVIANLTSLFHPFFCVVNEPSVRNFL